MKTHSVQTRALFRKVFLPLGGISLMVAGTLLFMKLLTKSDHSAQAVGNFRLGDTVPDLTVGKLNGKAVKISDFSSKLLVLNFWATWCAPCMNEIPSLLKLRSLYNRDVLEVIGINLDDEALEGVLSRVRNRFEISFPVFSDQDGSFSELFNVHAVPLTVILNQKRKILLVWDGEQDWASPEIQSKIKQWLADESI